MLHVSKNLDGVICHMDDIFIFGKNEEEYNHRLDAVLCRLQEARITLSKKKCKIRKTSGSWDTF